MGIIESTNIQTSIFPQQSHEINETQYRVISNYSYTHQADPYHGSNFQVLAHKHKPVMQLQRYELFFNSYEELRTYEEVYEWRNKSKYLVQGKTIKQRNSNHLCGSFHQATLFVERIPIRASEVTDVPIEEGLYLLYTAFLGFRKIYERTGYFDITLDVICITKEALVKIWLNSNLSKIYPQFYSLNQNFTESDFIRNLLAVCEPLIDFETVKEKFSDYLKACYFDSGETPKKEEGGKFCKYSTVRQSFELNKNKQQHSSHQSHARLSFDKIIDYFEGYLNKHKLVIAREMKSVRDLFKIQPRIDYKEAQCLSKRKVVTQGSKQKLQRLEFLPIFGDDLMNNRKKSTRRKNTKRSDKRELTDRSHPAKGQPLLSYKSQECVKNIMQLKEPQFIPQRPPSTSFAYYPLYNKHRQDNLSSPHLSPQKRYQIMGRDRIKSVATPNISFSLTRPQNYHLEQSLSPNNSQKSTQKMFYKDKRNEYSVLEDINRLQYQPGKRPIFPDFNRSNERVNKTGNFSRSELNGRGSGTFENQRLKQKRDPNHRKTVYAVKDEWTIDEEIAKDLDQFERSQLQS